MQIALVGAHGQLGTDLQKLLGSDAVPLGHADIEITDAGNVQRVLAALRPDFVINTAAYNLVDRAEDEPSVAFAVNAEGPRNLARHCAAYEIPLMHVSTDYVFGSDTQRTQPYRESDSTGPVGAYGRSKRNGEARIAQMVRGYRLTHLISSFPYRMEPQSVVRASFSRFFIVRTCGLYGHAAIGKAGKSNFVETMLRLGKERSELRIVNDQHCTPTSTADLARAIVALIDTDAFGVYHATNTGSTTWCGFAREIFRQANMNVNVVPITSAEFGAKARRPAYSVLDCRKLTGVIGFELPTWQDALATYLATRP